MLGVFAEFETNIRHKRQIKGIEAAKKAGVYKGRPAKTTGWCGIVDSWLPVLASAYREHSG